jgi:hypothetical protein
MKDIKRELLTFLYEQRTSLNHVSINHIFKHTELRPIDIKNLLGQLKASGIIKINKDYPLLGSSDPPRPRGSERHIKTTEDIPLSAMLTHEGERFVHEHYLKTDQPTITAGQLVYAHGDIKGTVTQSDNHSFLAKEQIKIPNIIPEKTENNIRKNTFSLIVKTVWNNIILVIISTLIAGYIIYRLGWNGQYVKPLNNQKDIINIEKK